MSVATTTETLRVSESTLPRDLLDLYTREAKSLDLLSPEEEKAALDRMIESRNAWLSSYLETEYAMEALWDDLERWKRDELASLSIIAGPPKLEPGQSGPEEYVARLYRIFERQRAVRGARPFRAVRRNRRLLRAVFFLGLRSGPLQRYREVTLDRCSVSLREKIEAAQRDFIEARSPLIEHNLRLVLKAARAFVPGPLPYNELVQEGNLGLIRATESFNNRFGVRFSTYAYLWIRQSIIRALENNSRTIRLPVSLTQHLRQLSQKVEKHEQEADPDGAPSPEAQRDRKKLEKMLSNPSVSGALLSLDFTPDENSSLGEGLPDEALPKPDSAINGDDLRRFILSSLHVLPERQRLVLRLRFGVDGRRPHSLSEIGRLLSLSAERIRQIQQLALENLRSGPDGDTLREIALD